MSLKLLHPFMPFVTEAIWQELKNLRVDKQYPDHLSSEVLTKEELLITASWPTTSS